MEITDAINGCGTASISNLGNHHNAFDAMLVFCARALGKPNIYRKGYNLLVVNYLFVAGPEVPKDMPGGSHHSKTWVKYGTEFAAFIVENGLGEVATTGQHFNTKHHPLTTSQVWIWSPNQEAMEAWWMANNTIQPKEEITRHYEDIEVSWEHIEMRKPDNPHKRPGY